MPDLNQAALAELTSEVVAAYVAKNHLQPSELPNLIASVHAALGGLGKPSTMAEEPAKLVPPVSIRKSITDEYLISMEDGKRYKSLKRHLGTHGMTPAEYRAKWGLPHDYPMVAPAYAAKRSEIAFQMKFGRRGAQNTAEAEVKVDEVGPEVEA
jgi:predicted transcriptional regulator